MNAMGKEESNRGGVGGVPVPWRAWSGINLLSLTAP